MLFLRQRIYMWKKIRHQFFTSKQITNIKAQIPLRSLYTIPDTRSGKNVFSENNWWLEIDRMEEKTQGSIFSQRTKPTFETRACPAQRGDVGSAASQYLGNLGHGLSGCLSECNSGREVT